MKPMTKKERAAFDAMVLAYIAESNIGIQFSLIREHFGTSWAWSYEHDAELARCLQRLRRAGKVSFKGAVEGWVAT